MDRPQNRIIDAAKRRRGAVRTFLRQRKAFDAELKQGEQGATVHA